MDGVSAVVRRGLRLVAAGTVVVAVVVAVTGPLLALRAGRDLEGVGALVMVGLGGVGLSLVARSFRSTLPRVALRCAATWVLAFAVGLCALLREARADRRRGCRVRRARGAVPGGHGDRGLAGPRLALGVVGPGRRRGRAACPSSSCVATVPLASGLFEAVREDYILTRKGMTRCVTNGDNK